MKSKGYFLEKVTNKYEFFPLPNGNADVFIYDLSSEKEVTQKCEQGTYTQYEYDMNEFQESMEKVSEEMIATDPIKYLNYEPEKEKTEMEMIQDLKEENNMLKECLLEMSELVYQ